MPNWPNGVRVVTVVSTNDYPTVRSGKNDNTTGGSIFLLDGSQQFVLSLNPTHTVAIIAL